MTTTNFAAYQQRLGSGSSYMVAPDQAIGMDASSLLSSSSRDCEDPCRTRPAQKKRKQRNKGGVICILLIVILVVLLAIFGLSLTTVVKDANAEEPLDADDKQMLLDQIEVLKQKQLDIHSRVRALGEEPTREDLQEDLDSLKMKIMDIDNGQEDIIEALDHLKHKLALGTKPPVDVPRPTTQPDHTTTTTTTTPRTRTVIDPRD